MSVGEESDGNGSGFEMVADANQTSIHNKPLSNDNLPGRSD